MNPRIVHQIWLQGGLPGPVLGALADGVRYRCVSTGWRYELWDEGSIWRLSAPGRETWNILAPACCHVSHRSDLLRCLVLYEYGGLYLDTDVELFRLPVGGFDGSWVAGTQDGSPTCVNPCVMSCAPSAPFLRRVLDGFGTIDLGRHCSTVDCVRNCLGPDVQTWPVTAWHGKRGQVGAFGHHYGWGNHTRSFARNPPGLAG